MDQKGANLETIAEALHLDDELIEKFKMSK
jgi:hypothetical protein